MHRFSKAVKRIPGFLPESIRSNIKKTPLEELYLRIRILTAEMDTYEFQTPAGEITLEFPSDYGLKEFANEPGGYEHTMVKTLNSELTPDSVFYDVGAYVGYMSRVARKAGVPASRIHAFEAVPFRYHILTRNCDEMNTNRTFVGRGEIGTVSLDEYATSHKQPTVVKIDVEGAEFDVLRGMERLLEEARPTLFVEIHPTLLPEGETDEDIVQYLFKQDYKTEFTAHRSTEHQWTKTISEVKYDQSTSAPTCLMKASPVENSGN